MPDEHIIIAKEGTIFMLYDEYWGLCRFTQFTIVSNGWIYINDLWHSDYLPKVENSPFRKSAYFSNPSIIESQSKKRCGMNLIIFSIIVLLISLFNALTMRFQAATLYWGKKLDPDNPLLPRGMQNALTPSFQNYRNIFLPISIFAIMVSGFIFFEWYIGLISAPIAFIIGGFISELLPKPESAYYYSKIHKVLLKRKNIYLRTNEELKLYAVKNVISLLNEISPH